MTNRPTPRSYERPTLEELGTLGAMTQGSFGLLGDALLQGPKGGLLGGGGGGGGGGGSVGGSV